MVMHTAAMRTPPTKPQQFQLTSEADDRRVRVTVPVPAEVLEAFQRMSKVSGLSVGRCMGDWLADTLDAAQFMTQTMEKARAAPKVVAQELHAYALGIGDSTRHLLEQLRQKGRADAGTGSSGHERRPGTTPPSNTGVTTTKNKTRKGGTDGKNRN
jgi:hypothetical protein